MNDQEFMEYCELHSHSPACCLTPLQLARLHRLCGNEELAREWDGVTARPIKCDGTTIRELLRKARRQAIGDNT